MVVHLRARVRACARSCVCACVRVGCEEGAGFEKRGDVDSRSWLRPLGDARGKIGRAVGVCRGGFAPRFVWDSGLVRAEGGV